MTSHASTVMSTAPAGYDTERTRIAPTRRDASPPRKSDVPQDRLDNKARREATPSPFRVDAMAEFKVGVTAGASTPDYDVEAVLEKLRAIG